MKHSSNKTFKERYSLQERQSMFERKQVIHPQKVLVIFEFKVNKDVLQIQLCAVDPTQMLIDFQSEMSNYIMKQKKPDQISIFICINNQIPNKCQTIEELYQRHKDPEDLFLYITAIPLEAFGRGN